MPTRATRSAGAASRRPCRRRSRAPASRLSWARARRGRPRRARTSRGRGTRRSGAVSIPRNPWKRLRVPPGVSTCVRRSAEPRPRRPRSRPSRPGGRPSPRGAARLPLSGYSIASVAQGEETISTLPSGSRTPDIFAAGFSPVRAPSGSRPRAHRSRAGSASPAVPPRRSRTCGRARSQPCSS